MYDNPYESSHQITKDSSQLPCGLLCSFNKPSIEADSNMPAFSDYFIVRGGLELHQKLYESSYFLFVEPSLIKAG